MSIYFLGGKLIHGQLCNTFENLVERPDEINYFILKDAAIYCVLIALFSK